MSKDEIVKRFKQHTGGILSMATARESAQLIEQQAKELETEKQYRKDLADEADRQQLQHETEKQTLRTQNETLKVGAKVNEDYLSSQITDLKSLLQIERIQNEELKQQRADLQCNLQKAADRQKRLEGFRTQNERLGKEVEAYKRTVTKVDIQFVEMGVVGLAAGFAEQFKKEANAQRTDGSSK